MGVAAACGRQPSQSDRRNGRAAVKCSQSGLGTSTVVRGAPLRTDYPIELLRRNAVKVSSGFYGNATEVIRDAGEQWGEKQIPIYRDKLIGAPEAIGLSIWLLLRSILVALRWGVHQCQPRS